MTENDKTLHEALTDSIRAKAQHLKMAAPGSEAWAESLLRDIELLTLAHRDELQKVGKLIVKHEGPTTVKVNGLYLGVADDITFNQELEDYRPPVWQGAGRRGVTRVRRDVDLRMPNFEADYDRYEDPNEDYRYN